MADHALPPIGYLCSEALGEAGRVTPPLPPSAAQRDDVAPRDAALVKVQHRALFGVVVGAEDRDAARDARLVDLRAHDKKGSAVAPREAGATVDLAWDQGVRALGAPLAD